MSVMRRGWFSLERLGWWAGAFWLAVLWAWLGQHIVLDADVLYLYDIGESLKRDPGGLYWALPAGPQLVPALGLSMLVSALTPSPEMWERFHALAMGASGWYVLSRLQTALLGCGPGEARVYSAAGMLFALGLAGDHAGLNAWMLPGYHGGALFVSLLLYAWALGWDEGWEPSWWTVAGGLGVGLVLGSDRFMGLWGVLPLVPMAARLKPRQWAWLVALGLLVALTAVLFAAGLYAMGSWLAGQPWRSLLTSSFAQHWVGLWQGLGKLQRAPWLAAVAALGWGLWAARRDADARGKGLLWGVLLGSAATVGVLALTQSIAERYLYLPLLIPILLLPSFVAERWGNWLIGVIGAVGVVSLVLLSARPDSVPAERLQADWFGRLARADRLECGWAGYWEARPLRLLSGVPLRIVPFEEGEPQLLVYAWAVDFHVMADRQALNQPDFVVVNGLTDEAVRQQFGAPRSITVGAGLRVFIYKRS